MTLLDERELTAEERAAIADEARPGVWIEEREVIVKLTGPPVISLRTGRPVEPIQPPPDIRGDGRVLDQAQTDQLIVLEVMRTMPEWRPTIRELVAPGQLPPTWIVNVDGALAEQQRGGISSDPAIRLLAYRAWGDRDRRWRKRDTCRALGTVANRAWRAAYGFEQIVAIDDGLAVSYTATRASREALVVVDRDTARTRAPEGWELLLDVYDELDARLTNPPSR